MQPNKLIRTLSLFMSSFLVALPALAHHPLGGLPMKTFADGLLSGLAHPVLGLDHLACAVVVGLCALRTAAPKRVPAGYIIAVLLGCVSAPMGLSLPMTELLVAGSLLVLGGLVMVQQKLTAPFALALFAFFGFFHGAALGESLTGAEGTASGAVLAGYLLGLGAVQYAVSVGVAGWLQARVSNPSLPDLHLRLAGATVAGMGMFLTAEFVEHAALSTIVAG